MPTLASSVFSLEPESREAGRIAGETLAARFSGEPLKACLVYATVNHDQGDLLDGFRAAVGPEVAILGCSVQGVVGDGQLTEEGIAMGAMGFGGAQLRCTTVIEREIQIDTGAKVRPWDARSRTLWARSPRSSWSFTIRCAGSTSRCCWRECAAS